MECIVCTENNIEILIKCHKCDQWVCCGCTIEWFTKNKKTLTCCCNNEVAYIPYFKKFGCKFYEKYWEVISNNLFIIEQSYFPESMKYANILELAYIFDQKYENVLSVKFWCQDKSIDEIRKNDKVRAYVSDLDNTPKFKIIMILSNEEKYCFNQYQCYIDELKAGNVQSDVQTDNVKVACKCITPQCNGVIFSSDYICTLCRIKLCEHCLEECKTEHVCNLELVESIKHIQNNSKMCPKCYQRIIKIDGCDQMFCVDCNTAFSWNTGKIETGRIHNPHYYEKLRSNGITLEQVQNQDNQCNEPGYSFRSLNSLLALFNNNLFIYNYSLTTYISKLKNLREHLLGFVAQYHHNSRNINNDCEFDYDHENKFMINYEPRIKFIINRLSKEDFQKHILLKYKKYKQKVEILNELYSFNECFRNLLLTLDQFVIEIVEKIKNYYEYLDKKEKQKDKQSFQGKESVYKYPTDIMYSTHKDSQSPVYNNHNPSETTEIMELFQKIINVFYILSENIQYFRNYCLEVNDFYIPEFYSKSNYYNQFNLVFYRNYKL